MADYNSSYTGAQIDEGVGKSLALKPSSSINRVYDSNVIGATTIAIFDAESSDLPLKNVLVKIEPVQSGSGNPSSSNRRTFSGWTGCNLTQTGKNLGNFIDGRGINTNGNIVDPTDRCATVAPIKIDTGKSYVVSHQSGSNAHFICAVWNNNTLVRRTANIDSGSTLDTSGGTHMYLCLYKDGGNTATVSADKPMVEIGTAPSAYEQFVGGTQEISWQTEAATVYAGTLDVTTGKLKARPYYAAYNGETLVGPWISDRDVYAAGTSPTTGAQVVDLGGTETVYQLTPHVITTLSGLNNIWADCGDVNITYGAYLAAINASSDCKNSITQNLIAPVLTSFIADTNLVSGNYRIINGELYKITASISSGGTITPGTNATKTTVLGSLMPAAGVSF